MSESREINESSMFWPDEWLAEPKEKKLRILKEEIFPHLEEWQQQMVTEAWDHLCGEKSKKAEELNRTAPFTFIDQLKQYEHECGPVTKSTAALLSGLTTIIEGDKKLIENFF